MVPAKALSPAEALAAAREMVKQADAAADPNSGKAWLLNEGIMGTGEKPGWFKSDKYKTVAAQAEAYVSLESRFGAFKGAPKNEKGEVAYKFTPPEGLGVEFNTEHPMVQAFNKWAGDAQLSQEGYDQIFGQLAAYEAQQIANQQPNFAEITKALGDDGQTRIATIAAWGKANLGPEGYATMRAATAGKNAAEVFKVLEAVIAKTGQVKMPKPGPDVPGATPGGELAQINAAFGAKDSAGKLRIYSEPGYRGKVEKQLQEYYAQLAASQG